MSLQIDQKVKTDLDASYVPAYLWNQAFRKKASEANGTDFAMALVQENGTCFSINEKFPYP